MLSGIWSVVLAFGMFSIFRFKQAGIVAFVLALAWSLSVAITLWERVILSESMTIH